MPFMLPAIQTYHLLHNSFLFPDTFSIHLSYCFLTCIYPSCDACVEFYHFVSVFDEYSRSLLASSAATAVNGNGFVLGQKRCGSCREVIFRHVDVDGIGDVST